MVVKQLQWRSGASLPVVLNIAYFQSPAGNSHSFLYVEQHILVLHTTTGTLLFVAQMTKEGLCQVFKLQLSTAVGSDISTQKAEIGFWHW